MENINNTENKRYDNFVNIHGHSYYSLLDGQGSPEAIVDKTLELGQPASCITDHGVMFSIVDHFNYAKEKGQKAIAGFEAYVVNNHKEKSNENGNNRQHLVLIAKNAEGYRKLSFLCSKGCTDGFYYRPRIDDELIKLVGPSGLIGSSACIAGRIPQYIINDQMDKAEEAVLHYKSLFEDFYLEIQPTMEKSQVKVNQGIIALSRKLNIPLLATSDFHYINREDAKTHDVLLCLQTGKLLSDPDRWSFPGDTFFICSRKEMEELFNHNGHEILPKDAIKEACDNTVKLANSCNFELESGVHYLPKINIPLECEKFVNWHKSKNNGEINQDTLSADYLRYLCIISLKAKGLTGKQYQDRLDYELKVINDMGFNDYFLIYYDIMKFCREESIPYGVGRGCFSPDNIVITKDSKKLIKDVKPGDIVRGHDEKEHEVLFTYEYDCDEEIVNIKVENNKNIKCTKDHKMYAIKQEDWEKGIRTPKWYPADELNEGDMIAELED